MQRKVLLKVTGALINLPDKEVGIARMQEVNTGWVVRVNGLTDFEGEQGMVQAIHIAMETTKAIAGYLDDDVELWDVVMIFDDEETATFAAKKNEQMAIYNIETSRLKWID